MHDPQVVAFAIVRPWPQRSGLPGGKPGQRWKIRYQHDCGEWCDGPEALAEAIAHRGYPNRAQRRSGKPCGGPGAFPWWKPSSYGRFWVLAGTDWYWPALITVWHVEPGGHDSGEVCRHYTRTEVSPGQFVTKVNRGWRWHVRHWRLQLHPLEHGRRWLLTRCTWCGGRSRKGDLVNFSHSWDGMPARWWRGELGLYHEDCSSVSHAHSLCLCADPLLEREYGTCAICGRFRPYAFVPGEADLLMADLPKGARLTGEVKEAVQAAWQRRKAASP